MAFSALASRNVEEPDDRSSGNVFHCAVCTRAVLLRCGGLHWSEA
jgi:hypothetical protein